MSKERDIKERINLYFKESDKELDDKRKFNVELENYYEGMIENWGEKINKLLLILNSDDRKEIDKSQYDSLYLQQELENELFKVMKAFSKLNSNKKVIARNKLMYYTQNSDFSITNASERKMLIESELSEIERALNIHETYMEFIRNTKDRARDFNFSIKSKIQLMEITAKYG